MDSVDNVSTDHEYVLCYGKKKNRLRGIARSYDNYKNPDNDPRGPWISDNLSAGKAGGDVHYEIEDPETGNKFYPPKGRYWPYNSATMKQKIKEGRVIFPSHPNGRPMLKRFKNEAKSETVPVSSYMRRLGDKKVSNALYTVLNTAGTKELQNLFSGKVFSHPKSTRLISSLSSQVLTDNDDVVLDFFAGSCTTAHAVMDYNSANVSNCKFIMVQLPERCEKGSEAFKMGLVTIADIGKERIRRAAAKIKEENPDYDGDLGFKVLKLGSSNIKPWDADFEDLEGSLLGAVDNIKSERSEEDVLYEILLKYGLDLALPIETRMIEGKKVFSIGLGALVICLDSHITLDVVEGIGKLKAELEPEVMRVVFKDNGFKDDVVKTNAIQILKRYDIEDVKSL